jgi:hypothetical protein
MRLLATTSAGLTTEQRARMAATQRIAKCRHDPSRLYRDKQVGSLEVRGAGGQRTARP